MGVHMIARVYVHTVILLSQLDMDTDRQSVDVAAAKLMMTRRYPIDQFQIIQAPNPCKDSLPSDGLHIYNYLYR